MLIFNLHCGKSKSNFQRGALKWTEGSKLSLRQLIFIKLISTRWHRSQRFSVSLESDMTGTWRFLSDVMEMSGFGTEIFFYSFFDQNFLLIAGSKLALRDLAPHFLNQFSGDIIPYCKKQQNFCQYHPEWEKNSALILLPYFYHFSFFL